MKRQHSTTPHHLVALDGVRGAAIIMVLGLHLDLIRGGFIGVDLFFVLSGFLITSILQSELERNGRINFVSFFLRRFLRLVPALTICVFVFSLYAVATSKFHIMLYPIITTMTYTMNYAYAYDFVGNNMMGHSWSLAVEMQFYVIWPFLLLFLSSHLNDKMVIVALVGLAAACTLWRLIVSIRYGEASIGITYRLLETRSDPLIFGGIIALLMRHGTAFTSRTLFAAACLFIAFVLWRVSAGRLVFHEVGFTLVGLAGAYIIGFLASVRQGLVKNIFENTILCFLGRISYGIYLYHFPFICILKERGVESWRWPALLLTIISALLSFHFIEKPFLRLKRDIRYASGFSSVPT